MALTVTLRKLGTVMRRRSDPWTFIEAVVYLRTDREMMFIDSCRVGIRSPDGLSSNNARRLFHDSDRSAYVRNVEQRKLSRLEVCGEGFQNNCGA